MQKMGVWGKSEDIERDAHSNTRLGDPRARYASRNGWWERRRRTPQSSAGARRQRTGVFRMMKKRPVPSTAGADLGGAKSGCMMNTRRMLLVALAAALLSAVGLASYRALPDPTVPVAQGQERPRRPVIGNPNVPDASHARSM